MGLKHLFHSTKADPADPTIIGATKWNADHFYVDSAGAPIGNVGALLLAGAAGALTHLNSVAAGSVLTSAGAGVLPVWAAPTGPGPATALQVDRLGVGVAPAAGTGTLTLAASGVVQWDTRSAIRSFSDGTVQFSNAAGTDFAMLRLGGTTAAFPALKRGGATVQVRKADDSDFSGFTAANITAAGNFDAWGVVLAAEIVATPTGGNASASVRIGAAQVGVYIGVGGPTVAAAKGSLYLRTDGSSAATRLYVNSDGATAWVAVTTAS